MNQPAKKLHRRYPGLRPFDRSQSAIFYGRNEDVQRLSNLILRERLTVLFSKSGIGKTSLLAAGVSPELEKKGFVPIFLRADKTGSSIVAEVQNTLRNHPQSYPAEQIDNFEIDDTGLWETVKRLDFDQDGLPATPVLIFDQFEEVFTLGHSLEVQDEFIDSLADLVNEEMPERVRLHLLNTLHETDSKVSRKVMNWLEEAPSLRCVVSIRSDFLHLLDEISPRIPGILRTRYQLQPLGKKQAREAIEAPAESKGKYVSPPFEYSEEALKQMVDFLAGGATEASNTSGRFREEIESFNLQILCRFIEEKIIEENREPGFEVTPAFYGSWDGMEREIKEFYTKQLRSSPLAYTRRTGKTVEDPNEFILTARMLIEESLVTPIGRRCSMVDDFLSATWNVSTDFLDTLVESRLLRKELRLDDYYYEITHDTLLPAIIESRDRRREQERADLEKAELQERLQDEADRRKAIEAELESVREKRRLARKVGILSSISFVLALAFAVWFSRNWINSLRDDITLAERNFQNESFDAAISSYSNLAENPLKTFALKRLIRRDPAYLLEEAKRFNALYDSTTTYLVSGDSLFFQKEYAYALNHYRIASKHHQQYGMRNYATSISGQDTTWRIRLAKVRERDNTLDLRIESNRNTLIDQFKISQRDAETFIEARVWGQALRNLRDMEKLLPIDQSDQDSLKATLNLVNQTPPEYVDYEIRKCKAHLRF